MLLTSGVLWPLPITLDVTEEFAKKLTPGSSKIALRDPEGVMLAVLDVEEVWRPDRLSARTRHNRMRDLAWRIWENTVEEP